MWVGDIGDNPGERTSISVSRVPVGRGRPDRRRGVVQLVYPDGAHDAEALLAHPETGQLYVVTRRCSAAGVRRAGAARDRPAQPAARGRADVTGLVTDGAFLPDGRHVVLRTYTKALVYTFPDLALVGDVDLPRQRQGEGIAVAPDESRST